MALVIVTVHDTVYDFSGDRVPSASAQFTPRSAMLSDPSADSSYLPIPLDAVAIVNGELIQQLLASTVDNLSYDAEIVYGNVRLPFNIEIPAVDIGFSYTFELADRDLETGLLTVPVNNPPAFGGIWPAEDQF